MMVPKNNSWIKFIIMNLKWFKKLKITTTKKELSLLLDLQKDKYTLLAIKIILKINSTCIKLKKQIVNAMYYAIKVKNRILEK